MYGPAPLPARTPLLEPEPRLRRAAHSIGSGSSVRVPGPAQPLTWRLRPRRRHHVKGIRLVVDPRDQRPDYQRFGRGRSRRLQDVSANPPGVPRLTSSRRVGTARPFGEARAFAQWPHRVAANTCHDGRSALRQGATVTSLREQPRRRLARRSLRWRRRGTVQRLQVFDEVDQLAERELIAIVGHRRSPALVGVTRSIDDARIGIDDRLHELPRMPAADAGEIRAGPRGGGK